MRLSVLVIAPLLLALVVMEAIDRSTWRVDSRMVYAAHAPAAHSLSGPRVQPHPQLSPHRGLPEGHPGFGHPPYPGHPAARDGGYYKVPFRIEEGPESRLIRCSSPFLCERHAVWV